MNSGMRIMVEIKTQSARQIKEHIHESITIGTAFEFSVPNLKFPLPGYDIFLIFGTFLIHDTNINLF